MTANRLDSEATCAAPLAGAAERAPLGGDACCDGSVAELARDLWSTRVCPAVYRCALVQGRLPLRAPALLVGWCDRAWPVEEAALLPRSWGRAVVGLRVALRVALARARLRPMLAA